MSSALSFGNFWHSWKFESGFHTKKKSVEEKVYIPNYLPLQNRSKLCMSFNLTIQDQTNFRVRNFIRLDLIYSSVNEILERCLCHMIPFFDPILILHLYLHTSICKINRPAYHWQRVENQSLIIKVVCWMQPFSRFVSAFAICCGHLMLWPLCYISHNIWCTVHKTPSPMQNISMKNHETE